jgi:hypothetical protein
VADEHRPFVAEELVQVLEMARDGEALPAARALEGLEHTEVALESARHRRQVPGRSRAAVKEDHAGPRDAIFAKMDHARLSVFTHVFIMGIAFS